MLKTEYGFTLAEVLITLGIIGIVAAITIPTLMQNIQDAQFKTAYRKAYSVVSQSWAQSIADNDVNPRTVDKSGAENLAYFNLFKAKMKVIKECVNNDNAQCWPNTESMGNPTSDAQAFIDASGVTWSMPCSSTVSTCGGDIFWVDVNGVAKPNQMGRDRFILVMANANSTKTNLAGDFPVKIIPAADTLVQNAWCPSPPCYNTSYIIGAK